VVESRITAVTDGVVSHNGEKRQRNPAIGYQTRSRVAGGLEMATAALRLPK